MLALERRNLILEKLQEEKRVVVSELSQLYSVSEETIRRDLDKLEKEGLATKSYGGAVINEDVGIDLPFNIRKNQNVQGKQKMAEIAASMVNDGDHIFLDASTTAVFVAKALKEKERLTVVTNSMEILLELSDVSGWNIISTGGVMKEGYLAFLRIGGDALADTVPDAVRAVLAQSSTNLTATQIFDYERIFGFLRKEPPQYRAGVLPGTWADGRYELAENSVTVAAAYFKRASSYSAWSGDGVSAAPDSVPQGATGDADGQPVSPSAAGGGTGSGSAAAGPGPEEAAGVPPDGGAGPEDDAA